MTRNKKNPRINPKRKALTLAIGHCLAISLTAGSAIAAEIFVSDGAVADVDDGQCSIVEAVINANNDDQSGSVDCVAGSASDTLLLPFDSVFTFTQPDAGSGVALPLITSDITVTGNAATLTRDSSAPEFGLISVQGSRLYLRTATLNNGTVNAGDGGCISVDTGNLSLRRVVLTGCSSSQYGGAIFANDSTVSLTSTTLSDNTASEAGGAFHAYGGSARLNNGALTGNRSRYGGAVSAIGGELETRYVSFSGNSASVDGGVVFASDVTFESSGDRMIGNAAGSDGGAMYLRESDVDLARMTIMNNVATRTGGGIRLDRTSGTLENAQVRNNTAAGGGGLFKNLYVFMISDSVFSGNASSREGGAILSNAGGLFVEDSEFLENRSDLSGGALYFNDGTLALANSTIEGNRAGSTGGGIQLADDSPPIVASIGGALFNRNIAEADGGAIHMAENASGGLRNVTFADNTSDDRGGAIFARQAALTATHVTFSGNAANEGENLWVNADGVAIELRNSIFAAGIDEGIDDCVIDAGNLAENINNITEDGTCNDNAVGLIEDDPQLEPLGRNGGLLTFGLMEGSPAIDSAEDTECVGTDQRDVLRPPTGCDIGAFELTSPIQVDLVSPGVGAVAINGVDGLCSLPEAMLNSTDNSQFSMGSDECEPGIENASDRIVLPDGALFTLTSPDLTKEATGLPVLRSRTTIEGNGATVARDAAMPFRLLRNSGELTIDHVTMTGGMSTGSGGAITNSGDLSLNAVTLSGNSAQGSGGAIRHSTGRDSRPLTMTNSTLSNNTASTGGAIGAYGETTIRNSTISGNTAQIAVSGANDSPVVVTSGRGYYGVGAGGAISAYGSDTLTLVNSTFAFNRGEQGNALFVGSPLSMTNTLVAEGVDGQPDCELRTSPYAGGIDGEIVVNTNNLIEDGSCDATFAGSGQSLIGPLANNGGPTETHALTLADNPAIDSGNALACAEFTYDQRGAPFLREADGDGNNAAQCDIGAFESDGMTAGDIIFRDGFE